jgi:hypothetical protein
MATPSSGRSSCGAGAHRLLLAAVALLAAFVAQPAPLAAQSLEVGGWLGWNRSSEITTDITICTAVGCGPSATMPHRWRQAPAGAVSLRAAPHPRFALRAELAVVPKGYPPPTHPYVTSTYLELPVAAELTWLRLRTADVTALAGIAPARLIACTVSADTVDGFRQRECGEEWRDGRVLGPQERDLGVLLGLGLRRPVAGGSATLELRHVHGVMDSAPWESGRTLNRTVTLIGGYALAVGRR